MADRFRFWGKVAPEQRTHLDLVAPRAQATPVSAGKVATFQIYDPIDSWGGIWGVSAKEFTAALMGLEDDIETIELRINSPGGDAFEAMAIINALRNHPATVVAVVDSMAASAAADIAISADRLIMADNAQLMIHRSWGLEIGTTEDLASYAKMLANLDNAQADLMVAKAGGTRDEWLAVMTPGTWYSAQEAKDAGLADEIQAVKPADAAEAKASARFDLSLLPERDPSRVPFMPAARATQTPADQPVAPPTDHKEADTMSDTIPTAGLVKALGLPDDADEDTILEAVEAQVTASATANKPGEKAAEPVVPDGKVLVSQNVLDELRDMAQSGVQARAKQLADERDETITAAFRAGKISAERKDHWAAAWDKDPEGTKADLESLPARFPVAKVEGYQGHDGIAGDSAKPFSDDEADALGALAGLPKGALR